MDAVEGDGGCYTGELEGILVFRDGIRVLKVTKIGHGNLGNRIGCT